MKREKSLADLQRSMYQNFIKYITSLTRIKDKINSYSEEILATKLKAIQLEMQQEKYIADKSWLLRQVDELKK